MNRQSKADRLWKAVSKRRYYEDSLPHWTEGKHSHPPQSASEASDMRKWRVERLRHYGVLTVAEVLEACCSKSRCVSGACPECVRAAQRVIVRLTADQIKNSGTQWHLISIVPADATRRMGNLTGKTIVQFTRRMAEFLKVSGAQQAFIGTDVSANEHHHGLFAAHWQLQAWVALPSIDWSKAELSVRAMFVKSDKVNRPVKAQRFDGQLKGLAYLYKRDFVRRVTYLQTRAERDSGVCWNTRDRYLRAGQKLELYAALHHAGLMARFAVIGSTQNSRTQPGDDEQA